eukprot:532700-Alexandrium_andersonii.AAC.1
MQPSPPETRMALVMGKVMPRSLHGCATSPITKKQLLTLRSRAVECVDRKSANNRSSDLSFEVAHKSDLDPAAAVV